MTGVSEVGPTLWRRPVAGDSHGRADAGVARPSRARKARTRRVRRRGLLVYLASAEALAEARAIVGDGVQIEQLTAAAIERAFRHGLSNSWPGVETLLADDERIVWPHPGWLAVVARGDGRLVRGRRSSCWELRRVLARPDMMGGARG